METARTADAESLIPANYLNKKTKINGTAHHEQEYPSDPDETDQVSHLEMFCVI